MAQALVEVLLGFVFLVARVSFTMAVSDCQLDLSHSNFTLAASLCSSQEVRGKCCRYVNAVVAISVSRYANVTGDLGNASDLSDTCLNSVSQTFELYGVTRSALGSCGFGTKIPVKYNCEGRTNVGEMMESPNFSNVSQNCKVSMLGDDNCWQCLNAGILYLRNLLGTVDNITLSTCRDAAFAAFASQVDYDLAIDIASCFFQVQGFLSPNGSSSLNSPGAASPQLAPVILSHHSFRFTIVPVIGIAVTALAIAVLVMLIILIRRKKQELRDTNNVQSCIFRKFSYMEIKKATKNFSTVIGEGGFGIVYKAEFLDGLVAAVKQMTRVSVQAEDDFCRNLKLLARLHHRHLVALRGFCIEKHQRFLVYEFMAKGSLKDHLHSRSKAPLSWSTRIRVAIDVANALEYLHVYCNPPLCHRDIKSSNVLLNENFVAKVADFGLGSKDGSIWFDSVNTEIQGTQGYMDPECLVTKELTEKSDIYSYGVVLLELVTGRPAIQDNKNLVEWSQEYLNSESMITELVDPYLGENFELDQLRTLVTVVKLCTNREGKARPSIKQVLRLIYECADPLQGEFMEAVGMKKWQDMEKAETGEGERASSAVKDVWHRLQARQNHTAVEEAFLKLVSHTPLTMLLSDVRLKTLVLYSCQTL